MTAAEKVLEWMKKYYEVNGTPNYGEIIAQLKMAIEEEKQEQNLPIDSFIGNLFGFELDGRLIELKAKSEQHALMQLVENYWELIDKAGKIELLGGRK